MEKDWISNQNEKENIMCNNFDLCNNKDVEESEEIINVNKANYEMGEYEKRDVSLIEMVKVNEVKGKENGSNEKVEKSKYHLHNRRKLESAIVI